MRIIDLIYLYIERPRGLRCGTAIRQWEYQNICYHDTSPRHVVAEMSPHATTRDNNHGKLEQPHPAGVLTYLLARPRTFATYKVK